MIADDLVWKIIRHDHCSYMAATKIETANFCRNPYNVTSICNQSSCPLANSRYATILDHDGVFYLYMKTIERGHLPKTLWERIKLPRNNAKALEIIDKHLLYTSEYLQRKIKQRLTKMTVMRNRMKKLAMKTREEIMATPRMAMKREARKEDKALKAALLDNAIETELFERLKKGTYPPQQQPVGMNILEEDIDQVDVDDPLVEFVVGDVELEKELEDDIEDYYHGLPTKKSHHDHGDDVYGTWDCK